MKAPTTSPATVVIAVAQTSRRNSSLIPTPRAASPLPIARVKTKPSHGAATGSTAATIASARRCITTSDPPQADGAKQAIGPHQQDRDHDQIRDDRLEFR